MGLTNQPISEARADQIVADVRKAKQKYGRHFSVNYSWNEIVEGLLLHCDRQEHTERKLVDALKAEIVQLKQKIAGYKTQNTRQKNQIEKLGESNERLQMDLERANKRANELANDNAELDKA